MTVYALRLSSPLLSLSLTSPRFEALWKVLLVDNTPERLVDTFYGYRHAQVLEAKAMVMDERMGRKSLAQIKESCRRVLVNAMKYGHTLYIRMSNTAAAFTTRYSDPRSLPLSIFDQAAIEGVRQNYTYPTGANLFGSGHALAAILRETDTEHGWFTARPGFEVVVSTHFAKADFAELLDRALPLNMLQPICPFVSERNPGGSGGQPAADGAAQGEGSCSSMVGAGQPIEQPWGLEDAQAAAVRLARRVEELRARRAGGGGGSSVSMTGLDCSRALATQGPPVGLVDGPRSAPGLQDPMAGHQRRGRSNLPLPPCSTGTGPARTSLLGTCGARVIPASQPPTSTMPLDRMYEGDMTGPELVRESMQQPLVHRCYASRADLERERRQADGHLAD